MKMLNLLRAAAAAFLAVAPMHARAEFRTPFNPPATQLAPGSTGPIDGMTVGGVTIPTALGAKAPLASPTFTGAVTAPVLSLTGAGSTGDLSATCAIAPWATQCRPLRESRLDTINVLDGQNPADAGVRDDVAIQAALNAAAARGGASVYLPPRAICYTLSAPLTVTQTAASYLPTLFYGGGAGTCVKAGVAMTTMLTLNGRFASVEGISFSNQGALATNAVTLTCATNIGNTNNFTTIRRNYFVGFTNAVRNVNCDGWRVEYNWFQNQTGFDIASNDNGVNSRIERNYSLGSAGNVLLDKNAYAVEGVYVDGNHFLPTSGKSIVFRACLSCYIRGNQIDQTNDTGITLDGSVNAIADIGISDNWIGPKVGATANDNGILISGNVVEVRLSANTTNGWRQCGVSMIGGTNSVQSIDIAFHRARNNGTGEGTGDICANPGSSAVGPYTVHNSWLLSGGTGQRSAIEYEGALGTWRDNRLAAPPTKSSKSLWQDNFGDDRDFTTGKFVPWKTFSFTPSCLVGTIGASATGAMRYYRDHNTVTWTAQVSTPDIGSCSNSLIINFPFPIGSDAFVFIGRNKTVNIALHGIGTVGNSAAATYNMSGGFPAANGSALTFSGTYEAIP
jgi:hypothetical protein